MAEAEEPERGRERGRGDIACRKKPEKRREKTKIRKTREGNKREKEPTHGDKNIAIMYTNCRELSTKHHCVVGTC